MGVFLHAQVWGDNEDKFQKIHAVWKTTYREIKSKDKDSLSFILKLKEGHRENPVAKINTFLY